MALSTESTQINGTTNQPQSQQENRSESSTKVIEEKSIENNSESSAKIGWSFLSQYYSFLNKDPSKLHCFYTKRSTLLHAIEGEDTEVCYGQTQIHQKIMNLKFEDCKVYISTVDSQSSAEGGYVVQVVGEMSNRGKPWRKFAQTFFLAPQPTGYFVLNDICRYLKEEGDEEEELSVPLPVESSTPSTTTTTIVPDLIPETSFDYSPPTTTEGYQSTSTTETTEDLLLTEPIPITYPNFQQSSLSSPSITTNGIHHDETPKIEPATTSPLPVTIPEPIPTVVATKAKVPKEVVQVITPAIASVSSSPSAKSQSPVVTPNPKAKLAKLVEPIPKPVVAATPAVVSTPTVPTPITLTSIQPEPKLIPTPTPKSSVPVVKSWAALAAAATTVVPKPKAKAAPIPSNGQPSTSSSSQTTPNNTTTSNSTSKYHPSVMAVTTHACFVKGVTDGVTDKALKDTLTEKYGVMKEFDVVRNKACAFIEFEKLDSARKAIQASMRIADGGEGGVHVISEIGGLPSDLLLHVVTKKPTGERSVSTNNSNNNNNNNNNRNNNNNANNNNNNNRGGGNVAGGEDRTGKVNGTAAVGGNQSGQQQRTASSTNGPPGSNTKVVANTPVVAEEGVVKPKSASKNKANKAATKPKVA